MVFHWHMVVVLYVIMVCWSCLFLGMRTWSALDLFEAVYFVHSTPSDWLW